MEVTYPPLCHFTPKVPGPVGTRRLKAPPSQSPEVASSLCPLSPLQLPVAYCSVSQQGPCWSVGGEFFIMTASLATPLDISQEHPSVIMTTENAHTRLNVCFMSRKMYRPSALHSVSFDDYMKWNNHHQDWDVGCFHHLSEFLLSPSASTRPQREPSSPRLSLEMTFVCS